MISLPYQDHLRLVWITDLHLADVPPGRRSANYREDILGKLRQVRDLCIEQQAYCLCGGDVFHSKSPNSIANSPSLIREVMEVFSQFPGHTVYGIVGNHDIQNDRMESLPQQPLGVLVESGAYTVVEHMRFLGPVRVYVDGYNYRTGGQLLVDLERAPRADKADCQIALCHAAAAPGKSKELSGETIIGYDDLQQCNYDLILWGHDHTRTETQSCNAVTHVNLGSLARAAFSADESQRPVSAVLIEFSAEGSRIVEHPLQVCPFEQVFRTADKAVVEVKKSEDMQAYFSGLTHSVQDITSADPIEVVERLTQDDLPLQAYIKEMCHL